MDENKRNRQNDPNDQEQTRSGTGEQGSQLDVRNEAGENSERAASETQTGNMGSGQHRVSSNNEEEDAGGGTLY